MTHSCLKGAHTIDLEARQSLRNLSLEHGRAIGTRCCVKSKILTENLLGQRLQPSHGGGSVSLAAFTPIKSGWKSNISGKGASKSMGNPISNPVAITPSTTNGKPICLSKDFVPFRGSWGRVCQRRSTIQAP
jgi:hypothetical protein